jgi:hypothetical protein
VRGPVWLTRGCRAAAASAGSASRPREVIAEWIGDGAPALDLCEISPARFAGRDLDDPDLRERCWRAYAIHHHAGGEASAAS